MNYSRLKVRARCGALICMALLSSCFVLARAQNITLKIKAKPFEEVVRIIREQTAYEVSVSRQYLQGTTPVTIDAKNMPVGVFLKTILQNQPLDSEIVIRPLC